MTRMTRMTAEERDEQLELVKFFIDQRRVSNWTELAKVLGISRQATQARFGKDGYGLTFPPAPVERIGNRIYLGLTDELKTRLDLAAGEQTQEYVRKLLDQHLPPLASR